jgi:hypothetical protein
VQETTGFDQVDRVRNGRELINATGGDFTPMSTLSVTMPEKVVRSPGWRQEFCAESQKFAESKTFLILLAIRRSSYIMRSLLVYQC